MVIVIRHEFIYTWQPVPLEFNLSTLISQTDSLPSVNSFVHKRNMHFFFLFCVQGGRQNCFTSHCRSNLKACCFLLFLMSFWIKKHFCFELIWQVIWRHRRQSLINNYIFLIPRSWLRTSHLMISCCNVVELRHFFDSYVFKLLCTRAATSKCSIIARKEGQKDFPHLTLLWGACAVNEGWAKQMFSALNLNVKVKL